MTSGRDMNAIYRRILIQLKQQRGVDFTGYRAKMAARRLHQRMAAVNCVHAGDYLIYIQDHPAELDRLIDSLTITVSRFFRNALVFEWIAANLLPTLPHNSALRIWSTGCANGQEPYSIAILLREFCRRHDALQPAATIFGTDIDEQALRRARRGIYAGENLQEVKWGLVNRYFKPLRVCLNDAEQSGACQFQLSSAIRQLVNFSYYDILDTRGGAPPESIYGGFDMIFCRNLLIYYNLAYQNRILAKLHGALNAGGYLVLGKSERLTDDFLSRFECVDATCRIYQKR